MGRFFHRNKTLLNALLAIAAVIGLFGPLAGDGGFVTAVGSMAEKFFSPVYVGVADRPLLLILAVGFVWNGWVSFYNRNHSASVLTANFNLVFHDPQGKKVTVERRHILRANHPNVSAYHFKLTPDKGGCVPKDQVRVQMINQIAGVTEKQHTFGDPRTGLECAHVVKPRMPYHWYLMLMPRIFLVNESQKPRKLFKNYLVEARVTSIYYDDFNRDEPTFAVSTGRYPHKFISVKLEFPARHKPEDIWAFREHSNTLDEVPVQDLGASKPSTYEVTVDNLHDEKLRIFWRYAQFEAQQARMS